MTFSGASPGCVLTGNEVVCTVATLPANSTQTFFIAVTAKESAVSGTVLDNQVVATSATLDPTPVNTATVTTTVAGFGNNADVGIVKTQATSVVTAGERITYTLTVTNSGPSAATNVRVLDLVPAGTTVVSMTAANPDFVGEFCSLGGSCYLGTVFTGTTASITVVLQVNADFAGGSLVNTAQASADQQDPQTGNNFASVTAQVNTAADLGVAKRDLVDPVFAGEVLPYQIVVTNSGPSDAQNVVVTDTLPVSVTFVGASPGCAETAPGSDIVVCQLGMIPAGGVSFVLIDVRVDADLAVSATLTNSATVASATADPNPTNNRYDEPTLAQLGALVPVDMTIAKTGAPAVVKAGEWVTYTLVVTNNGDGAASNVRVIDALPTGVSFVSASAATPSGYGLCNGGVTCELGDMPAGATATITLVVRVDPGQATGSSTWRAWRPPTRTATRPTTRPAPPPA